MKKNLFAIIFGKRQTLLRIRGALYKNKEFGFCIFYGLHYLCNAFFD